MWILTNFGAFMPALRPPETVPDGDTRTIQIRARRRKDLERLRDHYMGDDLGRTYTVRGADYQFRADCTPDALARTVALLALEIDYVSFKDTTVTRWRDHQLHDAYMGVWRVLHAALAPGRRGRPRRNRRAVQHDQDDLWGGCDSAVFRHTRP